MNYKDLFQTPLGIPLHKINEKDYYNEIEIPEAELQIKYKYSKGKYIKFKCKIWNAHLLLKYVMLEEYIGIPMYKAGVEEIKKRRALELTAMAQDVKTITPKRKIKKKNKPTVRR
jgi:hypothetical protein